jgi:CRP-like cAMP-binding protein
MDDFDFTKPQPAEAPEAASAPFKAAQSRFYDARVAAEIFRAAGREERFDTAAILFMEDEKAKGGLLRKASARMYYLADGQVELSIGGRSLDRVQPGEVFGEMAVISGQPRSASAQARTPVVAYSMDADELQAALGRSPEFALMLASVMYDRLRFLAARLATRKVATTVHKFSVFDAPLLARFEAALPRASTVRHWGGTEIMREGQAGAFMYVVKSGRVLIAIHGNTVEAVDPGGTFGEMAVVDQSPRTASATAEVECELLQVDRPSLLLAVKTDPAFAMALLRGVAERLRHMNAQLSAR